MQLSLFQPEPAKEKTYSSSPASALFKEKVKEVEVLKTTRDIRERMKKHLESCIPEQSIESIITWLLDHNVQLRITNNRTSKLGDYRPPKSGLPARISVNHDLNQYSFLITLVHEMAHHMVFDESCGNNFIFSFRRKKRPKPHGKEWQFHYHQLILPLLHTGIFPADILFALEQYLEDPKASTMADTHLFRILKKYDKPDGAAFLENLPFDAVFYLRDGRSFRKKEKIRTRYHCVSLNNGKIYLFNPVAQVYRN